MLRSAMGMTHVLRSRLVMGYTTSYFPQSEIDQIHLSIEAHCVTTLLPLGDCHNLFIVYYLYFPEQVICSLIIFFIIFDLEKLPWSHFFHEAILENLSIRVFLVLAEIKRIITFEKKTIADAACNELTLFYVITSCYINIRCHRSFIRWPTDC